MVYNIIFYNLNDKGIRMSKIELAEEIQQDINDLKEIFKYENYGLTKHQAHLQARAIIANLEDHLEELITK